MKNNQSITTIYGGIMGTFLKVTQYGKPHKKVADKVSDYFQNLPAYGTGRAEQH